MRKAAMLHVKEAKLNGHFLCYGIFTAMVFWCYCCGIFTDVSSEEVALEEKSHKIYITFFHCEKKHFQYLNFSFLYWFSHQLREQLKRWKGGWVKKKVC